MSYKRMQFQGCTIDHSVSLFSFIMVLRDMTPLNVINMLSSAAFMAKLPVL